jgi:hypothetical protein
MKKFYVMALMAMSVVLFSCGKSSSKTPQEQLKNGTWTLQTHVSTTVSPSSGTSTSSYDYSSYNYTLNFDSDTKATEKEGNTKTTSDYTLIDDVTLSWKGSTWTILKLSSTQLSITTTETSGSYSWTDRYDYARTN